MSRTTGWTAAKPPIIVCNLDAEQAERLRGHASRPQVLDVSDEPHAWKVAQEADILFTFARGWSGAPRHKPQDWPFNLQWVQIGSAGIDAFPHWVFDAPLVTTGRGISAEAIAEYIVATIFAHEKGVFDGLLVHSPDEWTRRALGSVSGKSVGIYGYGAIGRRAAQKLSALGATVSAVKRSPPDDTSEVRFFGSLKEMVSVVDHLVLAVPLTEATRRSVNAEIFAAAKPGLHVINICRGEVLDDDALLGALESGQVSAATLDVTAPEPLPVGHVFYTHPRIRLTPHISWSSEDSADRTAAKLHNNLDRFLAGETLADVVTAGRGY